jgi:tRNA dimethylallyltransferase
MRFLEAPSPAIAIVGPTAVGKTEISLRLAERLKGEIISADSRLFYRGLDIGTAKPTAAELRRAPHHLIDVADPDEIWSLAVFQQEACAEIARIQARGHLPLLVGGTGQYVWSVIEDWKIPAQEADTRLRQALERMAAEIGYQEMYERLKKIDPAAAAHIEMRNVRRTVRAFEVILRTGKLFSEQRLKGASPYQWLIVGLIRPREELYRRVDERIDTMVANGFIEEVRGLLKRGYSPDLPTLSAIGYREMVAHVRGEMTLADAVVQIKRQTRQYVRRQANWFKPDDPSIHWFNCGEDTADEVEEYIRSAKLSTDFGNGLTGLEG